MHGSDLSRWRLIFTPAMPRPVWKDLVRATLGGFAGIAVCAVFAWGANLSDVFPVFLIAPLGASAFLVFAVPNSPLAQPWSAVAGNTLAAVCGVAAAKFLDPAFAPAVGVAMAFAAMMFGRALHPPGGAVALLIALDPGLLERTGAVEICLNAGIMTAVLVGAGLAYHKLSGRKYPLRAGLAQGTAVGSSRLGLSKEELTDLLARFNQSANLGAVDLGRLLAAAEDEAIHHRFGDRTCGDVMTEITTAFGAGDPFHEIVRVFQQTDELAVPVLKEDGSIAGMVWQREVFNQLARTKSTRLILPAASAGKLMRPPDALFNADAPVGDAVVHMLRHGVQQVLIERNGVLKGRLTRSDILELALLSGGARKAA
ncbi:HPP family protein [Roseibium sp.]|uniref:HPP family protein n=1 Tax=Roseibium sp. TaxID=1936156 RepID=UPI003D101F63